MPVICPDIKLLLEYSNQAYIDSLNDNANLVIIQAENRNIDSGMDVTDAVVVLELPAGSSLNNAYPQPDSQDGQTVTWIIGNLAMGETSPEIIADIRLAFGLNSSVTYRVGAGSETLLECDNGDPNVISPIVYPYWLDPVVSSRVKWEYSSPL